MDLKICVDEIECALKVLKLGKSDSVDGLEREHIVLGGNAIKPG